MPTHLTVLHLRGIPYKVSPCAHLPHFHTCVASLALAHPAHSSHTSHTSPPAWHPLRWPPCVCGRSTRAHTATQKGRRSAPPASAPSAPAPPPLHPGSSAAYGRCGKVSESVRKCGAKARFAVHTFPPPTHLPGLPLMHLLPHPAYPLTSTPLPSPAQSPRLCHNAQAKHLLTRCLVQPILLPLALQPAPLPPLTSVTKLSPNTFSMGS